MRAAPALALFALAACAAGSNYTSASATGSRRATAAAVASGSTSGSSTGGDTTGGSGSTTGAATTRGNTSGSGTTSGAATTGSTTGAPCPTISDQIVENACDAGLFEVAGLLYDFVRQTALIGDAQVTTVADALNPSLFGSFDQCGVFHYCVAPGTTVTPLITVPQYTDLLLPQLIPTHDTAYIYDPGLYVVKQTSEALFDDFVPPLEVAQGIVLIQVDSSCANDNSGYSFHLEDGGGGVIPQPVVYLSSEGADPNATYTDPEGVALIYNISAVDLAFVVGENVAAPNFDAGCEFISTIDYGMTLKIPIQQGGVTFVPYKVAFPPP